MQPASDLERGSAALLVEGLTKDYSDGTRALDRLDLRVPAGSFFALLGPNGAGKTTLIGAVAGLVARPPGTSSCSATTRPSISRRASSSGGPRRKSTSTASSLPASCSPITAATSGCR